MSYLDKLRKQSSESLDKFKKFTEENNGKSFTKDDRFWKPTIDKAGNGKAKFRFLPPHQDEESPFVFYFQHFIRENGKVFGEKCPTTFGFEHRCPACEDIQPYWDGTEAEKKIASKRGRKKNFVANIYVIDDEGAPENNGKVFLYRFGVTIYDKITKAMEPDDDDEPKINPYDLFDSGANFLLKIKDKGGFQNYEDSKFLSQGALDVTDAQLEAIVEGIHQIEPLIAKSEFKSYDDLYQRYVKVIGGTPENAKLTASKGTGKATITTSTSDSSDGGDGANETVIADVDNIDFTNISFDD